MEYLIIKYWLHMFPEPVIVATTVDWMSWDSTWWELQAYKPTADWYDWLLDNV